MSDIEVLKNKINILENRIIELEKIIKNNFQQDEYYNISQEVNIDIENINRSNPSFINSNNPPIIHRQTAFNAY